MAGCKLCFNLSAVSPISVSAGLVLVFIFAHDRHQPGLSYCRPPCLRLFLPPSRILICPPWASQRRHHHPAGYPLQQGMSGSNARANAAKMSPHAGSPPDSCAGKSVDGRMRKKIPHWRLILDRATLTAEIESHDYAGTGTDSDPFVVSWLPGWDPRNAIDFGTFTKTMVSAVTALTVLAVSFASSAFVGAAPTMMPQMGLTVEVFTLGVSAFVLGFAFGPLLWAPLSELYGRQVVFAVTFAFFTFFNCMIPACSSIESVLVLRFFAGAFGSSPLTNAAGVISDVFPADRRGQAMAGFALAPFMGPVLGPIASNYLGEHASWRWVMALIAAFSGCMWIAGLAVVPETYAPYLLRRRAAALSAKTGRTYRSVLDLDRPTDDDSVWLVVRTALIRPWQLLVREPIVLLLSAYLAIVYGTLYLLFGAFPIVYMRARMWRPGKSSLPFLAVFIGMAIATAVAVVFGNWFYRRACRRYADKPPPEARLTPLVIGSIALPVGLFWFAWTCGPTTFWLAPVAAGLPFGFGMIMTFLATLNYLIDAYPIYAASVMAASSLLRSLFGAAFPLFTPKMYARLGLHWASSVPAFLALACIPFPFILLKYGPAIRRRCKYAALSQQYLDQLWASREQR